MFTENLYSAVYARTVYDESCISTGWVLFAILYRFYLCNFFLCTRCSLVVLSWLLAYALVNNGRLETQKYHIDMGELNASLIALKVYVSAVICSFFIFPYLSYAVPYHRIRSLIIFNSMTITSFLNVGNQWFIFSYFLVAQFSDTVTKPLYEEAVYGGSS